jgi:lysophospholipase L1-like esterase
MKLFIFPTFLLTTISLIAAARADQTSWKFTFSTTASPGFTAVSPTTLYTKDLGYGFEPGASIKEPTVATSDKPFYFSVALPEGNYKVTLTLGDPNADSNTTIKAELRRLMLNNIHVDAGKQIQQTIIVNLRTPQIPGGGKVSLKTREQTTEIWDWDEKLTLEFNGPHPAVSAIEISPAAVPTVYILGDSTVCDQPLEPWNSWGQMLTYFFKPDIAIANHAESGETIADSLHGKRFEKVFSLIKPGDYLFVQFGHNDMKSRAPNALDTYSSDLTNIVDRTRKLGGIPVLITSMERKNGVNQNTLMGYPDAVRQVAKEQNCALIDLNAMSKVLYKAFGSDIGKAFQDGTHHNAYGSYELAQCILLGIQQNKLDLAKSIITDWKTFDPTHPDAIASLKIPPSPKSSTTQPLGN